MRDHPFEFDYHLGEGVLHFWVVSHRASHRDRVFLLDPLDRKIPSALSKSYIDVGDARFEPAKQGKDELIRSGESRASDTQNMPVRDECPLEDRVVTLCCPHPERVPSFHDAIAGSIALENRVHDLRVVRIARVDSIGIEPVPNRRQRAEMPVPIKSVTALDSFGS